MTTDQLRLRKAEVDKSIRQLKAQIGDRNQRHLDLGINFPLGLRRCLKEELSDLQAESQQLQIQVHQFSRAGPEHINHWFRVAVRESMDKDEYDRLTARSIELKAEYDIKLIELVNAPVAPCNTPPWRVINVQEE